MDLRRVLAGRPIALPGAVDRVAERVARLPSRMRTLIALLLLGATFLTVQHRVAVTEARWGGTPVTVWRATGDLPAGALATGFERVTLPPAAVPPGAVRAPPDDAVLALAVPNGSVLTRAHLDPRGPAAGLPADLRAVPVPVDPGWRVEPGGWVDVWVLGAGDVPSQLVAQSRSVLQVRDEQGALTALVALRADEVAPVTAGLALGTILLAHTPEAAATAVD